MKLMIPGVCLLLPNCSLGAIGWLQLAGQALWVFAEWPRAAQQGSGRLGTSTSSITTSNQVRGGNGAVMGATVILPAITAPFSARRWRWGVACALFHALCWDPGEKKQRQQAGFCHWEELIVCDHREWWKIDIQVWNRLPLWIGFGRTTCD